jgi:hypothetical protein
MLDGWLLNAREANPGAARTLTMTSGLRQLSWIAKSLTERAFFASQQLTNVKKNRDWKTPHGSAIDEGTFGPNCAWPWTGPRGRRRAASHQARGPRFSAPPS